MIYRALFSLFLTVCSIAYIYGQNGPTVGVILGPTVSRVNTIVTVNGEKASDHDRSGRGLYGYHAGVYSTFPVADRWNLRAEIGYEMIRFEPLAEPIFGNGIIHHLRFAAMVDYYPVKAVGLLAGLEIVRRGSDITDDLPGIRRLNGNDVEGTYWQGILGISLPLPILPGWRIDAIATLPKIASASRLLNGSSSDNSFLEDQLRAFRLSLSVPFERW